MAEEPLLVDLLLDQVGFELELRTSVKLPTPRSQLRDTKRRIKKNLQKISDTYGREPSEADKLTIYLPYLAQIRDSLTFNPSDYKGSDLEKEKTIQAVDEFIRDIEAKE
jgi:hypothetical protein